jgi:hypothetical protein
MGAFSTVKIEAVREKLEKGKDAAEEMTSAIDFLSKALNNLNTDDPVESLVESVEESLIKGGLEERKWYKLWLGKGPTEAAEMAGDMAGNKFLQSAVAAIATSEGQAAVEQALAELVGVKDTDMVRYGSSGFGTKVTSTASGAAKIQSSRGSTDVADRAKVAAEITGNRVQTILALLKRVNSETTDSGRKQVMEEAAEQLKKFGFTADKAFTLLNDGVVTSVTTTSSLTTAMDTVNKPVEKLKDQVDQIANLDEPLKNLVETFNLMTPKPSEYKKLQSNIQAVFREIEGYKEFDKDGKLTKEVKGISKESLLVIQNMKKSGKDNIEVQETVLNLFDSVVNKIMKATGHTKEQAEALILNKETIISTIAAVDQMSQQMKAMANLNQAQLLLNNQLNDRHSKRNALTLQKELLEANLLKTTGELVVENTALEVKEGNSLYTTQLKNQEMVTGKEILQAQLEVINNQLDRMYQLRKVLLETFDQSAGGGLEQMILGESSGSEVAAKIAGDLQKATAGLLSDQLMTPVTGGLKKILGLGEDSIKLTPEAQAIQKVHNEHVDALKKALSAHVQGLGGTSLFTDDAPGMNNLLNTSGTGGTGAAADAAKEAITSKFSNMFSSFTSGFSSIFSSIFGGLGGLGSGLMSIFGLERGGVIGLAKGGMMPRYSDGGVATQPTYLVGEGKQNEAVVPLPDNRSIPVNLKGGGGVTNTNINVNIDSSGTSSDITSDEGGALGAMLDAAVQQTLERELRPGGILGG